MNKNIKKFTAYFRTRLSALRADESGAETMEIILIIGVVLLVLIPVIRLIINKVAASGNSTASCIAGGSAAGC